MSVLVIDKIWRIVRQFRWWTLIVAVILGFVFWQWLDDRLAGNRSPASPTDLVLDRSFPSPMTGVVVNLDRLGCQLAPSPGLVVGGELRSVQTCSLSLEYENIGGRVDEAKSEASDCSFEPQRFLILIDQRGRHYGPLTDTCPVERTDWPADNGQSLSMVVNFSLSSEAVADRLLVAGQLVNFNQPDRVAPAVALGETFQPSRELVDYTATNFDCQRLIDADKYVVNLWWRRLTNDINNDHYNPNRDLTIGRVRSHWQVCRLTIDYQSLDDEADRSWEDDCQLALYRRSRLIDERGRQHPALTDRICQSGEVVWSAGERATEVIEFVVDRWSQIERVVVAGQVINVVSRVGI